MSTVIDEPLDVKKPDDLEEDRKDDPPQLRFAEFEGHLGTVCKLSISGSVEVYDQALIDALRLGRTVRLVVEGSVDGRTHKLKRDADGYLSDVVEGAVVKIESVELEAEE